MGLLAEGGETPFVGSVSFLGGKIAGFDGVSAHRVRPDSRADVRPRRRPVSGLVFGNTVAGSTQNEAQRVDSRVDSRSYASLASERRRGTTKACCISRPYTHRPGTYDLSFTLRDDAGRERQLDRGDSQCPASGAGSLSSPIPVYEATPRARLDSLPRIVPTPRSTLRLARTRSCRSTSKAYGRRHRLSTPGGGVQRECVDAGLSERLAVPDATGAPLQRGVEHPYRDDSGSVR